MDSVDRLEGLYQSLSGMSLMIFCFGHPAWALSSFKTFPSFQYPLLDSVTGFLGAHGMKKELARLLYLAGSRIRATIPYMVDYG